jgi:AraC-like DNA-binding protein
VDIDSRSFLKIAEETLSFRYCAGGITPIRMPHTTNWRRCGELISANIVKGTVELQLEGQPTRPVRHGFTFALPPNVHHRADLVTRGEAVSRWSHVQFMILGSIDVGGLLEFPPVLPKKTSEKIGEINIELARIANADPLTLKHVFHKKALGFQMLATIAEIAAIRRRSLDYLDRVRRVVPVLEHIDTQLAGDLSRETLAERVHLSPSRFQAVFRHALGMSPGVYIQRQRIKKAQEMLVRTDLAVREIAEKTGHGDPFHFSRIFKKISGSSPAQYRQQARPSGM